MSAPFPAELYEYVASEYLSVTTSAQSTAMRLEAGYVYLLQTNLALLYRTDGSAAALASGSHLLGVAGWVPLPGTSAENALSYIGAAATTATLSKLRKVCI